MTNPIKSEFDAETGIHNERPMTAKELLDYEAALEAYAAHKTATELLAESRKSKLIALGLTEQELKA